MSNISAQAFVAKVVLILKKYMIFYVATENFRDTGRKSS